MLFHCHYRYSSLSSGRPYQLPPMRRVIFRLIGRLRKRWVWRVTRGSSSEWPILRVGDVHRLLAGRAVIEVLVQVEKLEIAVITRLNPLLPFLVFLLPNLSLQLLYLLNFIFPVFLQFFLDSDSPRIRAKIIVWFIFGHTLVLENLLIQINLERHLRVKNQTRRYVAVTIDLSVEGEIKLLPLLFDFNLAHLLDLISILFVQRRGRSY